METVNQVVDAVANVSISGGEKPPQKPQGQPEKKPKVDKKSKKAAADAEAGPLEV